MITFKSTKPNALLAAIKQAVDNGKITTWTYNANDCFTHTPDQWKGKAWLLPSVVPGSELHFAIVPPQSGRIGTEVYAIYHGRSIEMALAHFDSQFSDGTATALATAADKITAA